MAVGGGEEGVRVVMAMGGGVDGGEPNKCFLTA